MDDSQIWIDLGAILEAHRNRAFLRERAKKTKEDRNTASADLARWGIFEDCGSSYESTKAKADGSHNAVVDLKVGFEKNFKKLKLTFLETYPGRAEIILSTYLPGFQRDDAHE